MLASLAGYAAYSKDVAKKKMVGRLTNFNLEDGVELIRSASQSNGRLRLFLKDGREIRGRMLTEQIMRDLFPRAGQDELLAALVQLKQPVDLPLKAKTGLFAPLEHSAS